MVITDVWLHTSSVDPVQTTQKSKIHTQTTKVEESRRFSESELNEWAVLQLCMSIDFQYGTEAERNLVHASMQRWLICETRTAC